jgi:hypothetical protein
MHLTQAFAMLRPRAARVLHKLIYGHRPRCQPWLETLAIKTRLRDPVRVPSVLKRFNLDLGLRTTPSLAGITMLAGPHFVLDLKSIRC